jgi:outer membrane protein OmpA-like peptidoglycan-associated protein
MRLTSLSWSFGLMFLVAIASPLASAQDEFDDEFDDEVDEPPRRQQPQPRGADDEEDEFSDLEDAGEPADTGLEEGDLEDDGEDIEAPPDQQAEPVSDVEARRAYRDRRHILHNTWSGPVGGIHIVDAGSGADGAFRAQLGLDFFFIDGWLTLPDTPGRSTSHSHIGGSLSLSWTPWEFLEIYAALASWANSNEQEDPNLFQVLGDTQFGVKANYRVLPWLYLGGDVRIAFLNTVGDIGLVGESTSAGIRVNGTADLRELPGTEVPLIIRLNLEYYFDNSQVLIRDVESARFDAILDPESCPAEMGGGPGDCMEDRHLVTRVERYALQIDRVDHFTIGLGLEAPLRVMPDFYINPIAEWQMNIPVNRQGFSCLLIEGAGTPGVPPPGQDGCLDTQGVASFEQTLTLGVRVIPPLRGMNIMVGVDIGLTGVNTFVRELSGQAPYNVMLGFGYAFDTVPVVQEVEREVVREVRVGEPAPVRGRVVGQAVEQGSNQPIATAIVAFPGRELTSLAADASGNFRSYELEPGEVQMQVSHPEYNEGTCSATIPEEGGDVEVRCELEALPRMGSLRGTVTAEGAGPVGGARVQLSGPSTRTFTTGPDGSFVAADLPPGAYTARVESEAHFIRQDGFEIRPRETAQPNIVLIARPSRPLVSVSRRQITIRRQVNFATDSAEILPDSDALLSEVADVILRHPEITQIEIQGHTDNRGSHDHNMDLSQRRADSVRDWLVRAGVQAERLTTRGYGPDVPLVPPITAANRARNRRVQFMIQQQTGAQ